MDRERKVGMSGSDKDFSRRDFARSAALAASALGAPALFGSTQSGGEPKVGLYSITYQGLWYRGDALTLEQVVQRAKAFGYDGVEIDGKRPHGNPIDMPRDRCQHIARYAQDQGVPIYAVAANNDFSSPIPEHREAQLLYMRELIRMTADLNVHLLRVFAAWPGVTTFPEGGASYDFAKALWQTTHEGVPGERTWAWVRDGMKEATRYATDAGVTLALQNHPPVIHSYHDVLRMVKEVDSPNLKVCFDARIEKGANADTILEGTRAVGPLQVLSHYGNEYTEADGRIVPRWDELAKPQVAALLDIGYRGYIGFEYCHPAPTVDGRLSGLDFVDNDARLAARYMRDLIAEAKRGRILRATGA
jgi:sugar phosphate isomerase/epimerase